MTERVWERFLTDQDRAHVAATQRAPRGFGEQLALLLIDLYRWVFGDRPEPLLDAIKTWPGSCGLAGWQAVPKIQKLIAAAREVDIPVIHITGLDAIPGWSDHRTGTQDPSPEAAERRRRQYDIVDEVAPIEGEAVLRKSSPSAFWGTPLAGHLKLPGRRHARRGRRVDQRLRAGNGGRRSDVSLQHDRCGGVCLRPPRGDSRDQPLRHGPEIRRRDGLG